MKDIDFDELDKAVSAVLEPMEKKSKATAVKPAKESSVAASVPDATAEPEPAPASAPIVTANPAASTDDDKPTKSEEPKPETKPQTEDDNNVAVRVNRKPVAAIRPGRAGAFMDMVHPSSRMSGGSEKLAVAPSHTGLRLDPSSSAAPVTPKVEEEPAVEPKSTANAEPEAAAENPAPQSDPLGFHGFKYDDDAATASADKVDDKPAEPDAPLADETPAEATTKAEPYAPTFIEGTKVEKRPLGAFSDTTEDTPADENPAVGQPTDPADKPDEELSASAVNVPSHPREYDEDILNVESDHSAAIAKQPEAKPAEPATTLPASPVVASIPQQYQMKDHGQKESEPGPLFDTKDYHPPIVAHHDTPHKHLTAWVIVAVLLLLATAAAYGYWVYIGLN